MPAAAGRAATSDEQLMEQLHRGAPEALDELYRRYARKLWVFCARAMSAREPEDAVHDVFARVIEAADQYDASRATFRTWLYQIARNRCIDVARRQQRSRTVSLEGASEETDTWLRDSLADGGGSVEAAAMRGAIAVGVRECLEALASDDEREALLLFYVADRVYREVAEVIGKSISMAQKRVKLAREKMKRCLERKGFGES